MALRAASAVGRRVPGTASTLPPPTLPTASAVLWSSQRKYGQRRVPVHIARCRHAWRFVRRATQRSGAAPSTRATPTSTSCARSRSDLAWPLVSPRRPRRSLPVVDVLHSCPQPIRLCSKVVVRFRHTVGLDELFDATPLGLRRLRPLYDIVVEPAVVHQVVPH